MKSLILLTAVAGLLAGCGGKTSDPAQKYSSLKNDVKPFERKNLQQQFDACNVAVDADPAFSVPEGGTGSLKLVLKGKYGPTDDSLTVTRISKEAISPSQIHLTHGKSSAEGNEYTLSFSAPLGFIPRNKSADLFFVTLSPAALAKAGLSCPTVIAVQVTRSTETPVLKEIKYPSNQRYESLRDSSFSIDVKASHVQASDLELDMHFDATASNKENHVYNLSPALRLSDAVAVGNGSFRFQAIVDSVALKALVDKAMALEPTQRSVRFATTVSARDAVSSMASPATPIFITIERNATQAELDAERTASEKAAAKAAKAAAVKAPVAVAPPAAAAATPVADKATSASEVAPASTTIPSAAVVTDSSSANLSIKDVPVAKNSASGKKSASKARAASSSSKSKSKSKSKSNRTSQTQGSKS